MRQFIVLFAIFASASAFIAKPQEHDVHPTIEPYIFEDIINQTIESLRPNIPDPLAVDNVGINLPNNTILAGNGSISNLKLTGLQGFQVAALNFAIIGMRLNFTLLLPVIDFYTDFEGDFKVLDAVYLWGDGNVSVHIDSAEIQGTVQANLTSGISVENLRIQLQVGNVTFEIHGILDDEDLSSLISSVLNDLVAKYIDEYQDAISELLSPLLEEIINFILDSMTHTTTPAPIFDVTEGLN